MRAILDRLILSDFSEANDPFFLKHHGIQAILCFGDGGMFPEDIKLYYKPAPAITLQPEQLRDGIDFLRESLRAGRKVLTVGPTGATIVAAYLAEMGFSTAQARQMLGDTATGTRPDERLLKHHSEELVKRSTVSLNHA